MGIFRRKGGTTDQPAPQPPQTFGDKVDAAKAVWHEGQETFWTKELAKYQAKLDEMVAAGKGDSGAAQRTRKVIARCERKMAEGG